MEAPLIVEHPTNQILYRQSSVEIQLFPSAPEDDDEDNNTVQSCNQSLLRKAPSINKSAEEHNMSKQDLATYKSNFFLRIM